MRKHNPWFQMYQVMMLPLKCCYITSASFTPAVSQVVNTSLVSPPFSPQNHSINV